MKARPRARLSPECKDLHDGATQNKRASMNLSGRRVMAQKSDAFDTVPEYIVQSRRLSATDTQTIHRHWLSKVSNNISAPSEYTRMETGERFPSCAELATLPPEVQLAVRQLAIAMLKYRLLPMIAILQRRKVKAKLLRIALSNPDTGTRPSPSFLATLPVFARWDRLDEVVEALVPRVFVQDETIIHKGELPNSGLHIMTFGFAQPYLTEKQAHSEADPQPVVHLKSPSIIGSATVLTRHPQKENIKAISPECVVWVLPLEVFDRMFRMQLHDVQRFHEDAAMMARIRAMRKIWPVTWKLLRRFPIFSVLPEAVVVEYVPRKLTTKVYRAGSLIYRCGEPAASLMILVNGSVLLKRGNRRDSLSTRVPEETVICAPAIFGDLSWIQATRRRQNAYARELCDVYVLPRDAVTPMLNYIDTSQLLATAGESGEVPPNQVGKKKKQDELAAAIGLDFLKYVRYVRAIPLLQHLLPVNEVDDANNPLIRDLASSFSPTVFPLKSTLASTTQVCDRILFVLGGRAVVLIDKADSFRENIERRMRESSAFSVLQNSGGLQRQFSTSRSMSIFPSAMFSPSMSISLQGPISSPSHAKKLTSKMLVHGECVGYTMLHPHKWKHRVVAIDTVECVQLLFDDYEAILKRHNMYTKILTLTRALMFPLDAKPEAIAEAQGQVQKLRNITMYPVSSGVNDESNCRYPTVAVLQRLPPITLQNRLTTCTFSGASMSRITVGGLPQISLENLKPMVLGKHNKLLLPYAPHEKGISPVKE